MFSILVVEDDPALAQLYSTVLQKNGYQVHSAADGEQALDKLDKTYIDLVITDIMMPHMDGYELTRQLREARYNLPILMITAKETFPDKQQGFLVGTDDYMVKPVDVNEMLLRVGALLRRAQIVNDRRLTIGETIMDYDSLTLYQGDGACVLPQKEFYLLYKLISYPEHIFTRQQLMDEIWGLDTESDARTVDVHINRLREHLRDSRDIQIVTIRGLGYKGVKLHG